MVGAIASPDHPINTIGIRTVARRPSIERQQRLGPSWTSLAQTEQRRQPRGTGAAAPVGRRRPSGSGGYAGDSLTVYEPRVCSKAFAGGAVAGDTVGLERTWGTLSCAPFTKLAGLSSPNCQPWLPFPEVSQVPFGYTQIIVQKMSREQPKSSVFENDVTNKGRS